MARAPNPPRWVAPKKFAVDAVGEWSDHEHPQRHVDIYVFMRHEGEHAEMGWTARDVPTWWLDLTISDAGYVSAAMP